MFARTLSKTNKQIDFNHIEIQRPGVQKDLFPVDKEIMRGAVKWALIDIKNRAAS